MTNVYGWLGVHMAKIHGLILNLSWQKHSLSVNTQLRLHAPGGLHVGLCPTF